MTDPAWTPPATWANGEAGGTPIDADALNALEARAAAPGAWAIVDPGGSTLAAVEPGRWYSATGTLAFDPTSWFGATTVSDLVPYTGAVVRTQAAEVQTFDLDPLPFAAIILNLPLAGSGSFAAHAVAEWTVLDASGLILPDTLILDLRVLDVPSV